MKRDSLKLLAIVLGAGFAVFPALRGSWVWDDYLYIAQNASLRDLHGLGSIWCAPPGVNYFPVTDTLLWVEWHLWGEHTLGYHLTNLGLHIANCLLLWKLLRRLNVPNAWIAALFFAVHPIVVESVAWISELKNTLSTLLALLSTAVFWDYVESRRWSVLASAFGFFCAALLAKSTVALLPILFLGVLIWKRRSPGSPPLWGALPFFAAALAAGLSTIWFESHRAMAYPPAAVSLPSRLVHSAAAFIWYSRSIAAPDWWTFLTLATAIAGSATRVRPAVLAAGAVWFAIHLLPTIGLVPMAYQRISPVADHFAYLALPGALAIIAATGARRTWIAFAAIPMAIHAYGLAQHYRSDEQYWTAWAAREPGSWLAHNHLGAIVLRRGDLRSAEAEFRLSIRLKPDYEEAHNNLGALLLQEGQATPAVAEFRLALSGRPNWEEPRKNLANAYSQLGNQAIRSRNLGEAVRCFETAIDEDPANYSARNNLGVLYSHLWRLEQAIAQFQAALRLHPHYPEALTNLGNAFVRTGRTAQAIATYRAALRLDPAYPPASENLAYALSLGGRRP